MFVSKLVECMWKFVLRCIIKMSISSQSPYFTKKFKYSWLDDCYLLLKHILKSIWVLLVLRFRLPESYTTTSMMTQFQKWGPKNYTKNTYQCLFFLLAIIIYLSGALWIKHYTAYYFFIFIISLTITEQYSINSKNKMTRFALSLPVSLNYINIYKNTKVKVTLS